MLIFIYFFRRELQKKINSAINFPTNQQTNNIMSHKHLITEILSIASSILPPPPLSIRLYNSEIDADTIIQEQLSMNTEKIENLFKTLFSFLERHLQKLENNDLQQLSNILLILIAVPPPILPPIPEPSQRVKMVY